MAHMSGELRAGKRMPEGKLRSNVEFWVMALSARARRVQKAVCQETGLGVSGCWELVFVEAVKVDQAEISSRGKVDGLQELSLSAMITAWISRTQKSTTTMAGTRLGRVIRAISGSQCCPN